MHGAVHIAMALRTLGGESDRKISCFDVVWQVQNRCERWWCFQTCFIFVPRSLGKMIKFEEHIFSDGLKPPNQAGDLLYLGGLNTTELCEDYDKAL